MSRRLLIPLIVAIACAIVAPTAGAATVRVIDLQGEVYTADLTELEGREDVEDVGYAIRSPSGTDTETVTGFSLDLVIREAERPGPKETVLHPDPMTYDYLAVERPAGGSVLLTNGQVRQSGAFPDGEPVFYEDGNDAAFLRPSSGADDHNAGDHFSASSIVVRLRSGLPATVDGTASKTSAKVGEKIAFTAAASNVPAGRAVEYSWQFSDGTRKVGANVTHAFRTDGSHTALISAKYGEGEWPSEVIRITVGKTKKKGPDREGGGEDKSRDASDSGASDGTGGSPTGVVGGTGTGTSDGTTSTSAPSDPDRERREPPPPTALESVTGEVLDAPRTVPESTEEAAPPTARTGTPEPDEEEGAGIPGEAIGAAAILALFGLGALAELERLRPGGLLKLIPRVGR